MPVLSRTGAIALLTLATTSGLAPVSLPAHGVPNELIVISSTTLDGPFTMTVTNPSVDPVHAVLPAPKQVASVTVDAGTWDGLVWSLDLAPGATAEMSGTA